MTSHDDLPPLLRPRTPFEERCARNQVLSEIKEEKRRHLAEVAALERAKEQRRLTHRAAGRRALGGLGVLAAVAALISAAVDLGLL